jgi:hypothetical protein
METDIADIAKVHDLLNTIIAILAVFGLILAAIAAAISMREKRRATTRRPTGNNTLRDLGLEPCDLSETFKIHAARGDYNNRRRSEP